MARNIQFPLVRTVGFDGALVTFADRMTDTANRAALAF
ncbi:allophanate hydrolase subunit 1, partial [Ruegeria sp. NA]|nr:allophanate hydrolase subunit 1 [Ruegeria sp. NA]